MSAAVWFAKAGGQRWRDLASPVSLSLDQGMRLFLSQAPWIFSPAICLALWPLFSTFQALLCCQLGLLPPPQLFLYIWSQEGVLELTAGFRRACSERAAVLRFF